jgi:hypothetical protein
MADIRPPRRNMPCSGHNPPTAPSVEGGDEARQVGPAGGQPDRLTPGVWTRRTLGRRRQRADCAAPIRSAKGAQHRRPPHATARDARRASGRHKKWLGRQDSNLGWRIQSPLPYRLATPQRPKETHFCRGPRIFGPLVLPKQYSTVSRSAPWKRLARGRLTMASRRPSGAAAAPAAVAVGGPATPFRVLADAPGGRGLATVYRVPAWRPAARARANRQFDRPRPSRQPLAPRGWGLSEATICRRRARGGQSVHPARPVPPLGRAFPGCVAGHPGAHAASPPTHDPPGRRTMRHGAARKPRRLYAPFAVATCGPGWCTRPSTTGAIPLPGVNTTSSAETARRRLLPGSAR